ncbi:MAG: hypothetical protein ACE5KA_02615 [Nitrososphaerales archaeon]
MDLNSLLTEIDGLIRSHFSDALIWNEGSAGLRGKYFYTKTRGMEIGIFLGFTIDSEILKPHKCLVFVFADPRSRIVKDLATETEVLLEQMVCEIGQKHSLKSNFVAVRGDLPSLVRTLNIEQENEAKAMEFFKESLLVLVKSGLPLLHSSHASQGSNVT